MSNDWGGWNSLGRHIRTFILEPFECVIYIFFWSVALKSHKLSAKAYLQKFNKKTHNNFHALSIDIVCAQIFHRNVYWGLKWYKLCVCIAAAIATHFLWEFMYSRIPLRFTLKNAFYILKITNGFAITSNFMTAFAANYFPLS